jgi:glycosyltransferase involved in cell wall biosynthesis
MMLTVLKRDMKRIIKEIGFKLGVDIRTYAPNPYNRGCVSLKPSSQSEGDVLLSYLIEPFLMKKDISPESNHTHFGESFQMAHAFLDLGYSVDVIHYLDETFIPSKKYSVFVSARTNFQRIAQQLNEDCVKIAHLDTAHWLFNNCAAYSRCLALQKRKGISLKSYKMVEINYALEHADFATVLGNDFTMGTYSYAGKSLFPLSIPTVLTYPWPHDKNYEACRKNFLWFGSNGLIHKGLDLVLEAFADMPDYHLYVCGPINREKDFEAAYSKELYQTPNIHTIGWIDISSPDFIEITKECIGLVYPSCSEGQSGAVATCLQAGLIPIISYESGIDVHDFGVILNDCSPDTIKSAVQNISNLPATKLRQMSRSAWEYARIHHSRDRYANKYKEIISNILNMHSKKENHVECSNCTGKEISSSLYS